MESQAVFQAKTRANIISIELHPCSRWGRDSSPSEGYLHKSRTSAATNLQKCRTDVRLRWHFRRSLGPQNNCLRLKYRVSHLLVDLAWVDFDFVCSTNLPSCLADSAKFPLAQAEHSKSKSTQPSPRAYGTPCTISRRS